LLRGYPSLGRTSLLFPGFVVAVSFHVAGSSLARKERKKKKEEEKDGFLDIRY
jgi:hypothetical protein